MNQLALVDTHCHLDLFSDIQKFADKEDTSGIKTITVTNSPMFYLPNLNLFRTSKNIRVALGLHPELAAQHNVHLPLISELIADARFIGEIGLDGSRDFEQAYPVQLKNFETILGEVARHQGKILTVHTRNAVAQTVGLLHQYLSRTDCKVILHWYSGNMVEMKRAIDYGYYFSVNHRMLVNKKSALLIKELPLDRILTETDAPFTFDHKINTRTKSLEATLSGIAVIRGKTEADMRLMVYQNFKRLLG